MKISCPWPSNDFLMTKYHDSEWGVPIHNDQKLFEFLLLDAFQAGLSWKTILVKRENFNKAFDNFNYRKIAKYKKEKYELLLTDSGIIRNRAKINAAIINAQKLIEIQREFGSFAKYIWQFTGGKTKINKFTKSSQIPAKSRQSDKMSESLKNRGFKFTGSIICYAFMQASGMVNDHIVSCFRYRQLSKNK